jgi:hypothetical protein
MSDPFRDLEQSREAKFKMDEELRFKALCRRTRQLGLWAAENMGMTGTTAEGYSRSLIRQSLDSPATATVVGVIARDFSALGVKHTEADIAMMAERFYDCAVKQLTTEFPKALGFDHVPIGG